MTSPDVSDLRRILSRRPRSIRMTVRSPLNRSASGDFGISPELYRIEAPLLALNFMDDDINPVAFRALERAVAATPNSEFVLFPAGEKSEGHRTLAVPELWKRHISELLCRNPSRISNDS